jgi:2-amino-4-hydroxy-6-hydroxymethyldihydropteridine diphosphokinase
VSRVVAYVGIGSNLADPRQQVLAAFDELARLHESRLTGRSSLYRSAPVGGPPQPDYVNAVARLETGLAAGELLLELHAIERRRGRERRLANAPRVLDLDLLLYGDAVASGPALSLPHPRMHERAFVLEPLLELAPGIAVPGRGSARALLEACRPQRVERIA